MIFCDNTVKRIFKNGAKRDGSIIPGYAKNNLGLSSIDAYEICKLYGCKRCAGQSIPSYRRQGMGNKYNEITLSKLLINIDVLHIFKNKREFYIFNHLSPIILSNTQSEFHKNVCTHRNTAHITFL